MSSQASQPRPIRPRAIIIGTLLAALICGLTPINNIYNQATPLGGGHFPLAPFYFLLLTTLLAGLLSRMMPRARLITGQELLVIWMQMVIASGIAYTGLTRTFFINLTVPFQFATAENNWQSILQPLLPKLLYPEEGAVATLYNGLVDGRRMDWLEVLANIPWHYWSRPLLAWSIFIFLCYTVMVALINLLSRQWIHNERMNFPLLRVPMLMSESYDQQGLAGFLFHPYLLWGLSLPVLLHLFNGLNYYFPSVPALPTLVLAGPYFPKVGLLSGFIKLKLYLYPVFIGFAFLTARQISLSCWFFFLLGSLLVGLLTVMGYNIPASALGVTFGPTLARPEEIQMIGAYGVFALFLLWLSRQQLAYVLRQAVSPGPVAVNTEWFSVRLSFWIALAGMAAIVAWSVFFGMRPLSALLLVLAFFMITLVASRIICQGGLGYFTLTAAPIDGLLVLFGPALFSKAGLLIAAVAQKVLFVDLRESLTPSLLHAREVHHRLGNRRLLLLGIGLTLVTAVAVSFTAMLALCYKYGIRELQLEWATRTSLGVYENIVRFNDSGVEASRWLKIFTLVGAVVMLLLVSCYHRFYWWPIHPIGYLTAYSSAMRILWFSFFLGWLCNALCMRYGGVKLFKKLRFFFIGLIIGDLLMGGSWAIVGLFADGSYQVLPD
ncbi:DUF6785 family protein [Desulfogranum mediterraneum]|uniref:DUF6785 family protein n=1 Tax=Desulfogranum mediterraneum TaxID=160661 RepID=UPI00041DC7E3|nr:DUF6785 family protein [Desulfogranum mediterraneum]